MKTLSLVLILATISTAGFAQEIKISTKTIPPVIVKNLRMEYPHARISGATREIKNGDTLYEVVCKDSATKHTVTFHSDGIPIEIEEPMTIDQLPAAVVGAATKQYPKGKIMDIQMVMRGPVMTYELLIKEKKKKVEVEYDMNGKVVPKN
jgi:hypothetical protein